VAEIHEQRPDSSRSPVSAVSDGGFERVATKAGLFGIRHDGPLGSLYDSPIGRLLRTRFLLWRVLEHNSATVAFGEYQGILRKARWLLRRPGCDAVG